MSSSRFRTASWSRLHSSRSWLALFLAPIIAIAAAVALNIAVHANINWILALAIVVAVTTPIFFLINWISEPRILDDSLSFEAVRRISHTCSDLLDFYGTRRPEIKPPGAVSDAPSSGQVFSLDFLVRTADSIEGDLFIGRLAESNQRLTVVLGDHGSGKSTLLLRLAVRLADDYVQSRASTIPILLGARDWTETFSLRRWIVNQCVGSYSLRPEVVNKWADRGNIILILDGLDEVDAARRDLLIEALYKWSHSAEGTRVVVSCRTSTPGLEHIVRSLRADQLAMVRPLPEREVRLYAQSVLADFASRSPSITSDKLAGLRNLLQEQITQHESLRRPSMLGLLAATESPGSSDHVWPRRITRGSEQDPADPALRLGNELLGRGDLETAKGAYLAASRIDGSRYRALSTTLYGACEALLGNLDAARIAVQESVIARLKDSVAPVDPELRSKSMTVDERRVLRVMSSEVSYDLSQISSMAGLTPSRVDAALLSLKGIGAIESTNDEEDGTRYRVGGGFLIDA